MTVCTHDKEHVFGEISLGEMRLSQTGKIAKQCWMDIPAHFRNVGLDVFVIMPNHIHGILVFTSVVGIQNSESLQNTYQHIIPKSLGSVLRSFKGAVTRECGKQGINFAWQRNYFEHVIRGDEDLVRIREYILHNPSVWSENAESQESLRPYSL